MDPKTLLTGIIIATVGVASIGLPGRALGQTGTVSTLKIVQSGEPKGYAFLIPPKSTREVFVDVRPDSTIPPPDQWTWHVDNSDAQIKSALSMKWYAQASCPDDLTLLQVVGPAGTLTQNPLINPIWGTFSTQSFTVATIKNVCTDWANETTCDPAEPGCQLYEIFNLVGGVAPATNADRLRLKASCSSGALPTLDYAAKVRLRCNRVP